MIDYLLIVLIFVVLSYLMISGPISYYRKSESIEWGMFKRIKIKHYSFLFGSMRKIAKEEGIIISFLLTQLLSCFLVLIMLLGIICCLILYKNIGDAKNIILVVEGGGFLIFFTIDFIIAIVTELLSKHREKILKSKLKCDEEFNNMSHSI